MVCSLSVRAWEGFDAIGGSLCQEQRGKQQSTCVSSEWSEDYEEANGIYYT